MPDRKKIEAKEKARQELAEAVEAFENAKQAFIDFICDTVFMFLAGIIRKIKKMEGR